MDKEHLKGVMDKAKGKAKEGAGEATGNERLEGEGKIDKAKGKLHEVAGDVKDGVKKAAGKSG